MLDEPQFIVEPAHGLGVIQGARRVALLHTSDAQLGQRPRGGGTTRSAEVGEGVAQVARQIEGLTALRDGQCNGDSIRTVIEQRHDFFQWSQVKFAVRISHTVRAIERRAMTDGDHDVVYPGAVSASKIRWLPSESVTSAPVIACMPRGCAACANASEP